MVMKLTEGLFSVAAFNNACDPRAPASHDSKESSLKIINWLLLSVSTVAGNTEWIVCSVPRA